MAAPRIVVGATPSEAWKKGAQALLAEPKHELFSLVSVIENTVVEPRETLRKYDARAAGGKDTVFGVAAVLFPLLSRAAGENSGDYLDRCCSVLVRARQRGLLKGGWGTYFERLHGMDGADCQISRALHAYKDWKGRPKAAVVMHLSSPSLDSLRVQGSPCLQYVEITAPNASSLDLFAVYRNHDFVEKALGNFVGLVRLLRFICGETNNHVGSVICHSVHAYGAPVGRLGAMVAK